jgi:hypothetical protein
MLQRVCTTKLFWLGEAVHCHFESPGLHPAPLVTSAHVTMFGADKVYHIDIPTSEFTNALETLANSPWGTRVDMQSPK